MSNVGTPGVSSTHEAERLKRLRSYALLGRPSDPELDALARLAAFACHAPMAMVNLVEEDRVWVRARCGVEFGDAPRDAMMCTQTVAAGAPLIIPDLTRDQRFASSPFVAGAPWVRFYAGVPLLTDDGFALGTVCVLDSTPRSLAEGELCALQTIAHQVMAWLESQRTALTLQTVIEQTADGIVIADDRRRLSLNRAARQFFSTNGAVPSVETLPTGQTDEGVPLALSATPLERALRGEVVRDFRWRIPFRSRTRVLDASASPVRRADGSSAGAVLIVRDQTARARLEHATAESRDHAYDEVRARDDFLSIAAHELRTPVTALQLQAQGLRRQALDILPQALAERLDRMLEQGERLAKLINQLLDVSRITRDRLELEPEQVELRSLVFEVVGRYTTQAQRLGCTITVEAPVEVVGFWDRGRLEQVVTNLLSNAMKYGRGHPVLVTVRAEVDRAVLSVRDEGIGISPEDQSRIFERFERAAPSRRFGGLGLGLFIVRQIVDASGGAVEVRSVPGQGATFEVTLPRGPAPPIPRVT